MTSISPAAAAILVDWLVPLAATSPDAFWRVIVQAGEDCVNAIETPSAASAHEAYQIIKQIQAAADLRQSPPR